MKIFFRGSLVVRYTARMTRRGEQLFGTTLKTLALGELILTETQYPPFSRLPEHSHDFAYFCFVLQGTFTEKFGRQQRLCQPSTLIFHTPDETHADSFHRAGGRCFNLQLKTSLIERFADYPVKLNSSALFSDNLLAQLGSRIYREFCRPDELSALAIEGLFLELAAESGRAAKRLTENLKPGWLERVRALLHDRFAESLTLAELAAYAGRHPVHLAREFRRHYRCTIGEYQRQLRIDFAKRQLAKSDSPLSKIALDAGFSHQSHFTKAFRLLTCTTPQEFRRISRPR